MFATINSSPSVSGRFKSTDPSVTVHGPSATISRAPLSCNKDVANGSVDALEEQFDNEGEDVETEDPLRSGSVNVPLLMMTCGGGIRAGDWLVVIVDPGSGGVFALFSVGVVGVVGVLSGDGGEEGVVGVVGVLSGDGGEEGVVGVVGVLSGDGGEEGVVGVVVPLLSPVEAEEDGSLLSLSAPGKR
ncbi:protein of unknown function [Candidatus Nitrosocosmicus franklandus]|uniref:Uncharacterized protein n=1 Tax=Candidatus Nitrosocosmicus franklandianus TaxID=1798806 RepID=A0A484IDN4_9ARCH|nr:protein of unknown function [Candidatus Nitrosocosmicus franklandus]